MTHTMFSSAAVASSADINQTFVEQHTIAIEHLLTFVAAVTDYVPGMPGANAALQEALRPLRVPGGVNMLNALQWAKNGIEAEEKALALELQKEAALSTLKAAERHSRDAGRLALRARKAWMAISSVDPIVVTSSGSTRKSRASNAGHHNVAA